MAREVNEEGLVRLIIEEVDEARETLELARQLAPYLPIESFEQLGELGDIVFRGRRFGMKGFSDLVPEFLFPIRDEAALIPIVYEVVRVAPATVTYDLEKPENARRELRRMHLRRLAVATPMGLGSLGGRGAPSLQTSTGQ